jgi:glycosyltransferase involved in cell wall biosynthesis
MNSCAIPLLDLRSIPAGEPAAETVLVLAPCYYARFPSETIWQRLRVLARLGPVHVLSYLPGPAERIAPPEGTALEKWPATPAAALKFPGRVRQFAARRGGRGLIWTTPDYFCRRAAWAAAEATGWPVVVDVWDVPDLAAKNQMRDGRYLKALAHRLLQRSLRADLERADLVIWTLHPEAARFYFDPARARVLYHKNGVQLSRLRRLIKTEPNGRRPSPLRLLYMGYFQASRGSGLMVEMVGRLAGRLEVELDVVGSTAPAAVAKAVAAIPQPLRAKIRLHGHLRWDEAMEFLDRSDICLYPFPRLPELDFIYPLKLLEYAAAGKWIVSSDLVGARELLEGYPRVVFLDPASAIDWAEAVEALAKARPAAQPAGGSLERFDWERLNGVLEAQVRELLGGRWGRS